MLHLKEVAGGTARRGKMQGRWAGGRTAPLERESAGAERLTNEEEAKFIRAEEERGIGVKSAIRWRKKAPKAALHGVAGAARSEQRRKQTDEWRKNGQSK